MKILSIEFIRRLIYYGFCFIAIIAAFYTDLSPVVIVDIFEPKKDESSEAMISTEARILGKEPLFNEDALKEIRLKKKIEIDKNSITVEDATLSAQLDDIHRQLKSHRDGKDMPERFKKRLPSDAYPPSVFFYKPQEAPINHFSRHLHTDNQRLYLRFARKDDVKGATSNTVTLRTENNANRYKYLSLEYQIYSGDNFHLGAGLLKYPRPPTDMFYPYRKYSLWLVLFAILTYIALPVNTISPEAIRYPRWRVILTDLVASIFTFGFFCLPLLIIGSFNAAVTNYLPFTAIFWFFCLFGIFMIKIALWYGSYQIELVKDGLKIADYRGVRHFRFDEMEHFQPVIFKPP